MAHAVTFRLVMWGCEKLRPKTEQYLLQAHSVHIDKIQMNTNAVEYHGRMPQKALTMDDWIKFYGGLEEEVDTDSCTVTFYWVSHHDDCYGWWHIADDGGNEIHHYVAGNPDAEHYRAFISANGL